MHKVSLISVDAARTLAHVALLAAAEGYGEDAECIFGGLYAILPLEPNVQVCRAMVYAIQGKHVEASAILNEILTKYPNNIAAKGLLGLVRFAAGEPGWQRLLEDVLAKGADHASAKLARQILLNHREF